MNKEELINLLNTLDFVTIDNLTLVYRKKKRSQFSQFDDKDDYEPKTICIGTDFIKVINEIDANHSRQNNDLLDKICDLHRELEELKDE